MTRARVSSYRYWQPKYHHNRDPRCVRGSRLRLAGSARRRPCLGMNRKLEQSGYRLVPVAPSRRASASAPMTAAHDTACIPAVCLAERSRGGTHVASFIETVIIAAVVSVGIIAVGRAIIRGLSISRRPSHQLAEQTGTTPVPPEAQIPQTH